MKVPIHVICREMPFPAENDAEMDMIAIVEELSRLGHPVKFHYFSSTKRKMAVPSGLFDEIHVYHTRSGYSIFQNTPREMFIRSHPDLRKRLLADDHPILFHGLQTTHSILEIPMGRRTTILRLTRDDASYYGSLADIAKSRMDSLKYKLEKSRVSTYLKNIVGKVDYLMTPSDITTNISLIQNSTKNTVTDLKIPKKTPEFQEGLGGFCLYHGKLSKKENEFSAFWLLENVFNRLEIPFVIAGSGASEQLETAAHLRMHTCLVNNPSESELQDLIRKSQVVLLPVFCDAIQQYSLELSLSLGRHILINPKGNKKNEIGKLCHVAENPESYVAKIESLFKEPFTKENWSQRVNSDLFLAPQVNPGSVVSQLTTSHYQ